MIIHYDILRGLQRALDEKGLVLERWSTEISPRTWNPRSQWSTRKVHGRDLFVQGRTIQVDWEELSGGGVEVAVCIPSLVDKVGVCHHEDTIWAAYSALCKLLTLWPTAEAPAPVETPPGHLLATSTLETDVQQWETAGIQALAWEPHRHTSAGRNRRAELFPWVAELRLLDGELTVWVRPAKT